MATQAWMPFPTAVANKSKVEHRACQRFKAGIRCQLGDGLISALPPTLEHMHSALRDGLSHSTQVLTSLASGAKNAIVQATVDNLFKDSTEVNVIFEGNFGPVDEIGSRVPLEVIDGAIPLDFPTGIYIRNGPNPQFGGKIQVSPFGKLNHHWFEGDGMLHATYFGLDGAVSYQNKYVETEAYKEEKKQGKALWLNAVYGDPKAILMAYLFNQLRFNKINKETCNTQIFQHNGRLFTIAEGDHIPVEISPYNLESIGEWDVGKKWGRPFTSHPKIVHKTGELVIFGFSAKKPYYTTGIISADGKRFVQTCDCELERPVFSHELAITQNFDIIMYMPLTIEIDRLLRGEHLLKYNDDMQCKFGIKPRRGDASTIQWFPVESHFTFHVVNSYEEGDEIILHGCRARRSFLTNHHDMNRIDWFARGIDATLVDESLKDPRIDGALVATIHEWRFNLQTGSVTERDIITGQSSMEMPKINEKHLGLKYRYAYAQVLDHEASKPIGMPKYGRLVKIDLLEKDNGCALEFHGGEKDVFFSEPLFVSRPNSCVEDDGWVVTYVHDEKSNCSEVHILDAQNFSKPPIARIKLPQRVPYGFHSTFVHGLF